MMDKLETFLSSSHVRKVLYASLKIRLLILVLLFLLFSLVFFGIFVSPVIDANMKSKADVVNMQARVPMLITRYKNLEAMREQVKQLEKHNADERFNIPEKHSVPIFLSALNEAMSSSGVKIIDLSPAGIEKNKYLNLYALNFQAKLTGTFPSIVKLFVALIDMKDIAVITNITINRESSDKLILQLNLQTYSRQGGGS